MNVVKVFSGLMALRKLCNHPDLVTNDYCEYSKVGTSKEVDGPINGLSTIPVPKKRKRTRKHGDML